jgi:hypothetical protein
MRFLRTLALNRVAKRYARELPDQLRRAYGGARRYTPAEIRRAVAESGLDERFIGLAYAGHLTAEEFAMMPVKLPDSMSYEQARALLARYRPHGLASASGTP